MAFFETSAKDGSNIDEAFKLMISCNFRFDINRDIKKIKIST